LRRARFRGTACRAVFFPLDDRLELTTAGYCLRVLQKIVRQGGKVSFAEASSDLRELCELKVGPTHVQRLTVRVGREWETLRDREVAAFRQGKRAVAHRNQHQAAAVFLDGGRLQTRAADAGRGVTDPGWRETKTAAVESLHSQVQTTDPRPEPPRRFLDRPQVARLAAELKAARGQGPAPAPAQAARPKRQRRRKDPRRPRKRVRTVVATLQDSEAFGWQVAAEVHRRGLHRASRKACVCDGQQYNWTIWALHLVMLGFLPVLDFLHLVVYLYAAACAVEGKGTDAACSLRSSTSRRLLPQGRSPGYSTMGSTGWSRSGGRGLGSCSQSRHCRSQPIVA
jgi:hypothetical protein